MTNQANSEVVLFDFPLFQGENYLHRKPSGIEPHKTFTDIKASFNVSLPVIVGVSGTQRYRKETLKAA